MSNDRYVDADDPLAKAAELASENERLREELKSAYKLAEIYFRLAYGRISSVRSRLRAQYARARTTASKDRLDRHGHV